MLQGFTSNYLGWLAFLVSVGLWALERYRPRKFRGTICYNVRDFTRVITDYETTGRGHFQVDFWNVGTVTANGSNQRRPLRLVFKPGSIIEEASFSGIAHPEEGNFRGSLDKNTLIFDVGEFDPDTGFSVSLTVASSAEPPLVEGHFNGLRLRRTRTLHDLVGERFWVWSKSVFLVASASAYVAIQVPLYGRSIHVGPLVMLGNVVAIGAAFAIGALVASAFGVASNRYWGHTPPRDLHPRAKWAYRSIGMQQVPD